MISKYSEKMSYYKKELKYDLPAGISVFLVAIPLCLGIAHASGAPLISGIITGIIGGIIVGIISKSQLSVSGPAAGLTAIILSGISALGSFEAFLAATFLAGIIQVIIGLAKGGIIADYIPSSVIKGMLAAIGVIIIMKQFPHMIGYDLEKFGSMDFFLKTFSENANEPGNTLSVFLSSFTHINTGAMIIGLISLFTLIIWEKTLGKKLKTIPGSLIAVILGTSISVGYSKIAPLMTLSKEHLISLPVFNLSDGITSLLIFPDWSYLTNFSVYTTALTIALVASIETLLCVEAVDRLDSQKRVSPKNRELVAQGIGNSLCGLIGGLPMTSVIVRSSVNVSSGGKTKVSSIFHGTLILLSVVFFTTYINMIPLASLAAILVHTGFKLANPSQLKVISQKGKEQLLCFFVTVFAIVFTDLLLGVFVGIVVSLALILKNIYFSPVVNFVSDNKKSHDYKLILGENVSFFHKAKVIEKLNALPENSKIEVDYSKNVFADPDVDEAIKDFPSGASNKNITVTMKK